MRYTKLFASMALAVGMAVAGTSAASAQDFRGARQEYNRVDWVRSAIERDHARLAEDYRRGDRWAARRDRAELERHEAQLRAQYRDLRRDSGYGNGYRDNGYNRDFRGDRR